MVYADGLSFTLSRRIFSEMIGAVFKGVASLFCVVLQMAEPGN
jgi:hypothetical protein